MRNSDFILILDRSKDDAPRFSAEYQAELRLFSSQARASSQRAFARDSIVGGGGPLGEFIFNHGEALITALSSVGVAWLTVRGGRKLRLKFDGIEIEANNAQEVTDMLQQVSKFRDRQEEQP